MSFLECFSFCTNPSKKPRLSFRGGGDSSEAREVSAAAVEEVSAAAEQVVAAEVSAAAVQEQKKPVQYGLFRWFKPEADSGKPILTPESLKKPVGRPVREASQAATEMLQKVVEQQAADVAALKEAWEGMRASSGSRSRRPDSFIRGSGSGGFEHGESPLQAIALFQFPTQSASSIVEMPSTSNRAVPGRVPRGVYKRAVEPSAAEKVAMGKHLQKEMKHFASTKEFWWSMCKFYGRRQKQLARYLQDLDKNVKFMQERGLGAGFGRSISNKAGAQKKWLKVKQGLGKRASGAGRKDEFVFLKEKVKAWFETERENGITVYKHDLLRNYLPSADQE